MRVRRKATYCVAPLLATTSFLAEPARVAVCAVAELLCRRLSAQFRKHTAVPTQKRTVCRQRKATTTHPGRLRERQHRCASREALPRLTDRACHRRWRAASSSGRLTWNEQDVGEATFAKSGVGRTAREDAKATLGGGRSPQLSLG